MGMVIGIDVGGSTTKIIGVDKEGIKHPMIVKEIGRASCRERV